MRIGAIGIDSSHLPEFTRRIKALHDEGQTPCQVTHVFDPGGHDLPNAPKWLETVRQLGVAQVGSMEELLSSVEGVMVLAVNGNRHLSLASPSLSKGLPTYIDKPLACSLADAKQLLALATKTGALLQRIEPAFAPEVTEMEKVPLGTIRAIDAFGPANCTR